MTGIVKHYRSEALPPPTAGPLDTTAG